VIRGKAERDRNHKFLFGAKSAVVADLIIVGSFLIWADAV
jgi:hypothetical protein